VIRFLVQIDLAEADLPAFEAYERAMLALMPEHGGVLERRLRSVDGAVETHLLAFSSAEAFEGYLSDPRRTAMAPVWQACGAEATRWEVTEIEPT
jgi:hypothetical protein